MLKAGVVGCGHLGKIHTKLLFQSENYKLIGRSIRHCYSYTFSFQLC